MAIRPSSPARRLSSVLAGFILATACAPVVAQQPALAQDESLLAPIQLAARSGNYELALERLGRIKRLGLKTKGYGVLGSEYAHAGSLEEAERYFADAKQLLENRSMRGSERASAHLYLARALSRHDEFKDQAEEQLEAATDVIGGLAGISLDLGLVELAAVSFEINRDELEAKQILSLITDDRLRDKLLAQYE